jgi:type VI protein secretion system component VasK
MTSGERVALKGWTLMTLGVLAVVLGGLWTLQGLDLVGGSVMSGVSLWAVIGPVVAVAGLVLIVLGVRRRGRAKRQQQQQQQQQ